MSHAQTPALIAALSRGQRLPMVAELAVAFAVVVTKWDTRRRTRKSLSHLDPHLLQDIGLSSHDARTEAERPFWKA